MSKSDKVLLDLNNAVFQEALFSLEKEEATRLIGAFRKVKQLSWPEIYKDKGLRWELVQSMFGPDGQRHTLSASLRDSGLWLTGKDNLCAFYLSTRTMIPHINSLVGWCCEANPSGGFHPPYTLQNW